MDGRTERGREGERLAVSQAGPPGAYSRPSGSGPVSGVGGAAVCAAEGVRRFKRVCNHRLRMYMLHTLYEQHVDLALSKEQCSIAVFWYALVIILSTRKDSRITLSDERMQATDTRHNEEALADARPADVSRGGDDSDFTEMMVRSFVLPIHPADRTRCDEDDEDSDH